MMSLRDRVKGLSFFRQLDERTIDDIVRRGIWFSLAGGWELFRQGTHSRTLFLVVSGRLIIVRSGQNGDEIVGYVRAGEPVGEMSLLSGEPHSASAFALRDTELIALPHADFERMSGKDADFALALTRSVLTRAKNPRASLQRSPPRVYAFVATSPSVDIEARAREIEHLANRYGVRARAAGEADSPALIQDLDFVESGRDVVILAVRVGDNDWFRFALRHADRFLVFARRDARPQRPFPLALSEDSPARKFRLVDLVMIEEGSPAAAVAEWSAAIGANRVFHWRNDASAARLARIVAGKSVGLVLSGGGARAYAHLGVVRALREKNVPIDLVGGASMGAIVAACFAMGWSDQEIESRIRDGFVKSNPLSDYVLPVVALTRGRVVEERLKRNFGDARIEDLETPFFCVSSELVGGALKVHREGALFEALQASIALPGILPPVVRGSEVLVDGAVMDNCPTGEMAKLHRGLTIAVDVAQRGSIDAADFSEPPGFLEWARTRGLKTAPPIVTLLMRAATARTEATAPQAAADILIAPPIPGVELRDWRKFEPAVRAGHAAAEAALAERWSDLKAIVAAGRAA